jgi:hypothetical protein
MNFAFQSVKQNIQHGLYSVVTAGDQYGSVFLGREKKIYCLLLHKAVSLGSASLTMAMQISCLELILRVREALGYNFGLAMASLNFY